MSDIKEVKIKVSLTVPFVSYGTKKKDAKAAAAIRQWVRSIVSEELNFIPMYVELDEYGVFFGQQILGLGHVNSFLFIM